MEVKIYNNVIEYPINSNIAKFPNNFNGDFDQRKIPQWINILIMNENFLKKLNDIPPNVNTVIFQDCYTSVPNTVKNILIHFDEKNTAPIDKTIYLYRHGLNRNIYVNEINHNIYNISPIKNIDIKDFPLTCIKLTPKNK